MTDFCAESGWSIEMMFLFPKTLISPKCRCGADVMLFLQNMLNIFNVCIEMKILLQVIFFNTLHYQFFLLYKFIQIKFLFDDNRGREKCYCLFTLFNLDPGRVGPHFQDIF